MFIYFAKINRKFDILKRKGFFFVFHVIPPKLCVKFLTTIFLSNYTNYTNSLKQSFKGEFHEFLTLYYQF